MLPSWSRASFFSFYRSEEISDFLVDFAHIREVEQRIKLARQIDKYEHQLQKQHHDKGWLKKMANDLDIELDEDV